MKIGHRKEEMLIVIDTVLEHICLAHKKLAACWCKCCAKEIDYLF